jgi:hypothetical protein
VLLSVFCSSFDLLVRLVKTRRVRISKKKKNMSGSSAVLDWLSLRPPIDLRGAPMAAWPYWAGLVHLQSFLVLVQQLVWRLIDRVRLEAKS